MGPIVSAQWLVRFRWAVAAGAAITLLAGWTALDLRFDIAIVVMTLAIQVVSNVWLSLQLSSDDRIARIPLGVVALLDVTLLTAIILATGGPSNPFTIGYLVYITLAATTLNARWAWAVTAASVGCYGLLFVEPLRTRFDEHAMHAAMQPGLGHQVGMWVAFFVAAVLTATFVTRIRAAVEARERALAEARRAAARQERLASLTTLAAGAAHELATPLATIAVAARELDRAATASGTAANLAEDARLIRSQVERCREILDQMSGRADGAIVQAPQTIAPAAVVQAAVESFTDADRQRLSVAVEHAPSLHVPAHAAARTLRTLIKNALEASAGDTSVTVAVSATNGHVQFAVHDRGAGMTPEVLARVGEPFFTTKAPGAGFGLGVFLARTFAEQWGGQLTLDSRPGEGTTAALSLPAAERR